MTFSGHLCFSIVTIVHEVFLFIYAQQKDHMASYTVNKCRCIITTTGHALFHGHWTFVHINQIKLSIDACMVWCHGIFPTRFRLSLILTAAVSGRRHPCSWRSNAHGCPLSAIVRFQWPAAAFGTVCRLMSRQLQHSTFSRIASRHTSSQDHFRITLNCFSVPASYTMDSSGLAVFT